MTDRVGRKPKLPTNMNPTDLLPGALLGSGPIRFSKGKVQVSKPPRWESWGTPLDSPGADVTDFRKGFAGDADCPTESYCTFKDKSWPSASLNSSKLALLIQAVKSWEEFARGSCPHTLPPSWFEEAKRSVHGPLKSSAKTLLMAVQGHLVRNGALLLPWPTLVEFYSGRPAEEVTQRFMSLCGAEALKDATKDGDEFSFSHHSTFFYRGAETRLKGFELKGPYGAWGVVSIAPVIPEEKRLLGFITLVVENPRSKAEKHRASYLYGVKSRTRDGAPETRKAPWNLEGSVWNRVLTADPTGTKTISYSKSALYVENLCASKSSVKNVGKLLLLWGLAWFVPSQIMSTYLELGFHGPAYQPGMVVYRETGHDDFICAQVPSTYAASVYHQVFKYQRLFSLAPDALKSATSYIESCVNSMAFEIVDGWLDIKTPAQRKQIKAVLRERYVKAFMANLSVFKLDFPPPYSPHTRAPEDPKFASDREAMVRQGSLTPKHIHADFDKEPHRFMRYFMYRPYPTETHLRSIFLDLLCE
jgi:hypothetical protein